MKLIYSGFDTLVFAIKGAAKPSTLKYLEFVKNLAAQDQQDRVIEFDEGKLGGLIGPTGVKGGYAYLMRFHGDLGHVVSLKSNLNRNMWNAHVKIRALALATYGWEAALEMVFNDLEVLGFFGRELSLNRVDYAMDYLNAGITLNPEDIVAHARVKKAANKLEVDTVTRGQNCETVTIGKMPNRQIIIYDKRREVIEKHNRAWFEIWGVDRNDHTQTVHRVEIRLGKNELKKSEIVSLEDFKAKVNAALTRAVHVVRYVEADTGLNRSRWPNKAIWDHVQTHVRDHVLRNPDFVDVARVKHVLRSQKAIECSKLILGNMANLSVFEDMPRDQMKDRMVKFVKEHFSQIEAQENHPFWKSRAKTQDRFLFLEEGG